MNKLYLFKNFSFLGGLALGTIAATGIATTPARAAVIGEVEWDNGTSNFFEDVFEGGDTSVFTDFQVTFSPGDLAASFNTNGVFDPPLQFADPGAPQDLDVPAVIGFFELAPGETGLGNTADYVLAQDLIFELSDPDTNGSVFITFTADDDEFLAAKDIDVVTNNVVGVDLEEVTSRAFVDIDQDGDGNIDLSFGPGQAEEILTFGVLDGASFGEYGAEVIVQEVVVPEPATILGLLAVGGLGFGLKPKKQL